MRIFLTVIMGLLLAGPGWSAEPQTPIDMTIRQVFDNPPSPTQLVAIVGQAVRAGSARGHFVLRDGTGGISVRNFCNSGRSVTNGDRVRVTGYIRCFNRGIPWFHDTSIKVLEHGMPPPTVLAEPAEIIRGAYNYMPVSVEGVITDVAPDDADPYRFWTWFLVEQSGVKVPCTFYSRDPNQMKRLYQLVDATVRITGMAGPDISQRGFMRTHVNAPSLDDIRVIEPPPVDPFACEAFESTSRDRLEGIRKIAHRRRLSGRLIAGWGRRNLFVRLANGNKIRVRLGEEQDLPPPNALVSVAGFLRKDAFFAWFDNALLRVDAPPQGDLEEPLDIDIARLFPPDGTPAVDSTMNGALIRLRGRVRSIYRPGTTFGCFEMDVGPTIVPVEIGMTSPPEIGSEVEVTGVCIVNSETEDRRSLFTRIHGISLAPRRQDDVRVICGPPWWTPSRFFAAISLLLAVIVAIVIWNISLTRVSDRKSRELLNEKSARLESQLRVDERTRLAIELHDSLAQNLTGVSLQLDAAEMAADTDPKESAERLGNARRALKSCREGLRYCLSDLRSQTFEHADMAEAITETVRPNIGKTRLSVRFNVPRSLLSDSSAHAVLCIVRELAVNAVRHGRASEIKVAGELDNGAIRFSVRDNGMGFDPSSHPGSEEGHFGLLGVRERVKAFKGEFNIMSSATAGTKAIVTLHL